LCFFRIYCPRVGRRPAHSSSATRRRSSVVLLAPFTLFAPPSLFLSSFEDVDLGPSHTGPFTYRLLWLFYFLCFFVALLRTPLSGVPLRSFRTPELMFTAPEWVLPLVASSRLPESYPVRLRFFQISRHCGPPLLASRFPAPPPTFNPSPYHLNPCVANYFSRHRVRHFPFIPLSLSPPPVPPSFRLAFRWAGLVGINLVPPLLPFSFRPTTVCSPLRLVAPSDVVFSLTTFPRRLFPVRVTCPRCILCASSINLQVMPPRDLV